MPHTLINEGKTVTLVRFFFNSRTHPNIYECESTVDIDIYLVINEVTVTCGAPYLDVELEVLVHLVDVGEDVSNDTRDDSLQVWVVHETLKHTAVT